LNAERDDGDGAVSSGGVPGIGTASRTVGVPGVGVVPTFGACAFGATRRGETGVGPACVGGTAFLGTCSFAIACGAPLKTFGDEIGRDVPLKTFGDETGRGVPFGTFVARTACGVPLKTFGDETVCGVPLVVCVGTVANVRPNRRAPNGRAPGLFGVCRVQAFS
jgi:hypothetical protein